MPDATSYARRLLRSLDVATPVSAPPLPARSAPETALSGALLALRTLAPHSALRDLSLLTERAAHHGFGSATATSAGGATRLLRCADTYVALSLARPDDVAVVPALVEGPVTDPWTAIGTWASQRPAAFVRDRAVLLGLACALPGEMTAGVPWVITPRPFVPRSRPRVLDLSSLWAGPLCASLLAGLGCEVVKLEDPARPDGARANPSWFARLHPRATFAALASLPELLPTADVVIEGSRPRALRHKGFRAEDFPGVWVSITGYGRDQPHRIGYGDDAAIAGGLIGPGPSFVGDAVADPLTGVHAALAVWALLTTRRGGLVDIALARTAAAAASL